MNKLSSNILPFACVVCLFQNYAGASLGSPSTSIQSESHQLHATVSKNVEHSQLYSVRIAANEDRSVREYSNPSGTVFALTWVGRNSPDFKIILGDYFDEFHKADHLVPMNRMDSVRRVTSAHVVMQQSGVMGHVMGLVYIPSLVPSGVTLGELK